jgi:hypothetical protein
MLKIKYFSGLEEVFDRVMVKDVDHVLIRHSYVRGTRIYPHVHHDAAEWVVASSGHFKVSSMGDEEEFNLKGEDVVTIYYPAGREHALTVLGERLDYFVIRKHV